MSVFVCVCVCVCESVCVCEERGENPTRILLQGPATHSGFGFDVNVVLHVVARLGVRRSRLPHGLFTGGRRRHGPDQKHTQATGTRSFTAPSRLTAADSRGSSSIQSFSRAPPPFPTQPSSFSFSSSTYKGYFSKTQP